MVGDLSDRELIAKVFRELPDEKIDKLLNYAHLLTDWNTKVNLVSRQDIVNVVRRHIVPCLAFAKISNFSSGEQVIDIGTGGGLPGIPLAIICDDTKFALIDSVGKKIMAVNDMISRLGLKNAEATNVRAEACAGQFDKIVARAVTNLNIFVKYSKKLLKAGGKIFYLKGGDCFRDFMLFKSHKVYRVGDVTGLPELADKVILELVI